MVINFFWLMDVVLGNQGNLKHEHPPKKGFVSFLFYWMCWVVLCSYIFQITKNKLNYKLRYRLYHVYFSYCDFESSIHRFLAGKGGVSQVLWRGRVGLGVVKKEVDVRRGRGLRGWGLICLNNLCVSPPLSATKPSLQGYLDSVHFYCA